MSRAVTSSSAIVAQPESRYSSRRMLSPNWMNRAVLGAFVVAWMLGSAGGRPCCCRTAAAAQASLIQATDTASEARAALPPCCVRQVIAAQRNPACKAVGKHCESSLPSAADDGLKCDCPCCITASPVTILNDQFLRVEPSTQWAVIDWPSSLSLASRPELDVSYPQHAGPPASSAPERLAWLSRWIK